MYDCHSHSFLSDGELGPAELARRAEHRGLSGLAVTDHVDPVTVEDIVSPLADHVEELRDAMEIDLLAGCEITHTPPDLIESVASRARKAGAEIVLVHGETLVEPVPAGTNQAAVGTPNVDVLAHPGLVEEATVERAADNGVMLEISARKGHALANGHLVRRVRETDARLVVNTDAHAPRDLITTEFAESVVRGSGHPDPRKVLENNERLFHRCRGG